MVNFSIYFLLSDMFTLSASRSWPQWSCSKRYSCSAAKSIWGVFMSLTQWNLILWLDLPLCLFVKLIFHSWCWYLIHYLCQLFKLKFANHNRFSPVLSSLSKRRVKMNKRRAKMNHQMRASEHLNTAVLNVQGIIKFHIWFHLFMMISWLF